MFSSRCFLCPSSARGKIWCCDEGQSIRMFKIAPAFSPGMSMSMLFTQGLLMIRFGVPKIKICSLSWKSPLLKVQKPLVGARLFYPASSTPLTYFVGAFSWTSLRRGGCSTPEQSPRRRTTRRRGKLPPSGGKGLPGWVNAKAFPSSCKEKMSHFFQPSTYKSQPSKAQVMFVRLAAFPILQVTSLQND